MLILGLMSGTSLDGMNCVLTRITGQVPALSVQLESFSSFPLATSQRSRIELACHPRSGRVDLINVLNFEIGDPSVIAHLTGGTTVGNFRTADVAAGGQEAPLVSYVDWLLWRHLREARVILNIGGIANLTYLPAGAEAADAIAFDTGPGNLLIDFFVRRVTGGRKSYDENGRLAGEGQVDRSWL